MHETFKRSLAKTIIWRIIGTVITWAVIYVFTGELQKSTNITLLVAVILAIGYYVNERVWNSIQWGRAYQHYSK
jgi:uncharacterized membrane protein